MTANIKLSENQPNDNYKPKPLFAKANWIDYKSYIRDAVDELPTIHENKDSIERAITALTNTIQAADKRFIPKTKQTTRCPFPPHIVTQIKAKRKLRRQYNRTHSVATKNEINRLNKEIKTEISQFKQDQSANLWQSTSHKDPKSFWPTVKRFMRQPSSISTQPLNYNGQTYTTPEEQVKCFHELYKDIHSIPVPRPGSEDLNIQVENYIATSLRPNSPQPSRITEFPCTVSPEEILQGIKKTKNTSPGADGIYYSHIKNQPMEALRYLSTIYEVSMKIQHFPQQWKKGITILLPKPNKDHSIPKNYRPITLLSTLGKTLERLINSRLMKYLEAHNKINDYQAGYRKNRCTADVITHLLQDASHRIHLGHSTIAAFYDVEKTFDKVWHNGLLYKLSTKSGLSNGIIKLIQSFLSDRTTRYKVNSSLSVELTLPAGTPQGSILSPTLFILWVNDIPQPTELGTYLGLYADDLTIWASHPCEIVARDKLQTYNNKIERWSDLWRISYNPAKTQCILFKKKRPSNPYAMAIFVKNTRVPTSESATLLGVTMDSKLKMSKHFDNLYNKTKKRIPLLKLIAGNYYHPKAQPATTMAVYNTMIRPIAEYAPTALILLQDHHFRKLESLQIKALKIAYHLPNYTSGRYVQEELRKLDCPKTRIQNLAKKYINRQPPTSRLHRTIQETKDAVRRNKHRPPAKTPIGRILLLN